MTSLVSDKICMACFAFGFQNDLSENNIKEKSQLKCRVLFKDLIEEC